MIFRLCLCDTKDAQCCLLKKVNTWKNLLVYLVGLCFKKPCEGVEFHVRERQISKISILS